MVILLIGLVCGCVALFAFALHVDPLTGRIGRAALRAWLAQHRSRAGLASQRTYRYYFYNDSPG
ncbi:hypothetical protein DID96_17970 [Burkholderia sp. Bp8963]|uniref:hypothetical protein n=1 Tax=Burkholderia sp. Bp8963 TaxID=2184547 RepID=UPI000F59EE72|nr:hypothetical protein [Burkholderia sp. Bp8963]RQS69257.1 hypothetical protein DID96_17970 [Burkholderia sp. Bp8963]